jgi:hypothetical protein
VEWPNRLDPKGSTRDFEELEAFNRRLEQDCVRTHFELTSLLAADEQAAAEMTFQLTFCRAVRGAQDGLRGNLALFSWIEHERIVRQHLYISFAAQR